MTFRSSKAWWPRLTWQERERGGGWRKRGGGEHAGGRKRDEQDASRWWRWWEGGREVKGDERRQEWRGRENQMWAEGETGVKRWERKTHKDEKRRSLKTGMRTEKVIHGRGQSLLSFCYCCETNFLVRVEKYTLLHKAAECCIVSLLGKLR